MDEQLVMNNCAIIQQGDGPHGGMLKVCSQLHQEYSVRHAADYNAYIDTFPPELMDEQHRHPYWKKLALLRQYCRMVKDDGSRFYDYVIWLDSDCIIVGDEDIRNACPPDGIGCTYHELDWGKIAPAAYDHWNAGVIAVSNTPKTRQFLDDWWNAPVEEHGWADQHGLNMLIKIQPDVVKTIPHKWNSCPPYFEAEDEVVRAYHGLFPPEVRLQMMEEVIGNYELGIKNKGQEPSVRNSQFSIRNFAEPPYWKARILSEKLWRKLQYDLGPKEYAIA